MTDCELPDMLWRAYRGEAMEDTAGCDAETRLLKVAEVAHIFRVSRSTVVRLIREGKLQAVRVGRMYRIDAEDVLAFLETERT